MQHDRALTLGLLRREESVCMGLVYDMRWKRFMTKMLVPVPRERRGFGTCSPERKRVSCASKHGSNRDFSRVLNDGRIIRELRYPTLYE